MTAGRKTFILESSVGSPSLTAFSLKLCLIGICLHSAPAILSPWPSLVFPLTNSPVSLWVCPFYDSLGLGVRHCGTLLATQQGLELLQQLVERREAGQGLGQAADAQETSGDLSVGDRTPALKGNLPTCSLITMWGSQQGSTSEGTWDPSRRAAQNQA